MKSFISILLLSLPAFSTLPSFAWDNPGHMAVAGLAYDELSAPQRQRLVTWLRAHPDLSVIKEGFPDGNLPNDREFVMAAATWPDLIKSKTKVYHDNGYEADDPAITVVTYSTNMHKGWHFIDTPLWVDAGPARRLPDAPQVNAVGLINVLVSQLQTGEAHGAKAYDLGWLLHLVGDLHQPLHAVTGVSVIYPHGDTGGNDITLSGETHGEHELHAFWDDILGKTAHLDRTTHHPRLDKDIITANQIVASVQGVSLTADPDSVDPTVWASESYQVAQQDVYDFESQAMHGDRKDTLVAKLDSTYGDTATRDAQMRIRVAGHRLAVVLKSLL
jgi:hypothetical protein